MDKSLKNINETFYKDYDMDLFVNKAVLLGDIIANPAAIKARINSGYKVGKISIESGSITQKWLMSHAKKEIVINSYHAIESFFRLFFAHIDEPSCPWIGVEQLRSFKEFRDRIDKLTRHEYFTNHDKEIADLLLGDRKIYKNLSDTQWEKSVKNAVHFLDRFGRDILNNQDYNAYKHGAALVDTQFGFKLGDGDILKANKQDTFVYLDSKIKKSRKKETISFNKVYKFMRWQQRFVTTYITGELIHNLLVIHQTRLGILKSQKSKIYSFHHLDPAKILDIDKKGKIVPDTIGMSLFEISREKKVRKTVS